MSYDSILETTAVKVIVDDTDLNRRLQQATRAAKRAYKTQETAAVSASNGAARAARKQVAAQDSVSDEIQRNARLAMTLRREYENGIKTTEQFTREAEDLRKKLFDQAKQVNRTDKAYDKAQLGAQRLSTALATTRGETSKLGLSANVATGTQNAFRQALQRTGPAGQAASGALGLMQSGFAGLRQPIDLSHRSLSRFMGVARAMPAVLSAATVAAGALAVGGMFRLAGKAAEAADAVDKGAQSAGLSAEAYQELRFAFQQSGISADQFDQSVQSLNRRLGLAAQGQKTYREAYDRLGISIRDANGQVREAEEVITEAIGVLSEYESSAEAAAEASIIFGDDVGKRLTPVINEGADGIQALRDQARELGLVMSGDAVMSLVEYKDQVQILKDQLATARVEIAASFLPVLESLVEVAQDQLVPALQSLGEWLGDFTGNLTSATEEGEEFRKDLAASTATALQFAAGLGSVGSAAIGMLELVRAGAAGVGAAIGNTIGQLETAIGGEAIELGLRGQEKIRSGDVIGGYRDIFAAISQMDDIEIGFDTDQLNDAVRGASAGAAESAVNWFERSRGLMDVASNGEDFAQAFLDSLVTSDDVERILGGGTPPGAPPGGNGNGDGEPSGTDSDPVSVKSVGEIARDIRTREGIVDTTLARQAFDPSAFPDEGMNVPVRMAWQSDRDEAIANALWASGEGDAQMSEPNRVGVLLDMEARRGQEAIFNALAGEGGATEDANRVPVAVDWRSRQDQAIFDALSGGTLFGQGSEPGRVQTMMELQASRRDTVWLNALTGSEGGTTEDPNRVPVALDWRDRRDEAIANALWNTRERDAQMTDDASRVSVTFTAQELRDQAIFDALAGRGGVTGDPSRVPVALDWRDRQDQAIFDALSGGSLFGQTSDSTFSMSVTFDWQELQDQAIFEALSGQGGTTEDPMRVPVALDWRSRQDEAIFDALGAGTAFGQTSDRMFRAPMPLDRVAQDQAIFGQLTSPLASTGVSDPGLSGGDMDAWADAREAAAQAAEEQQQAADNFSQQVVASSFAFTEGIIDSIRSGDIGDAFSEAFRAASDITGAANFGSMDFLGGSIGIASLVSGGLGLLGSVFGGLFNDPSDEEDAAARSRRNRPSSFEINVEMNQINTFENGATAPDALARSGRDMLSELEEVIKSGLRSVDDRLTVLEERTA